MFLLNSFLPERNIKELVPDTNTFFVNDIAPLFSSILKTGAHIRFRATGNSMKPNIKNGDIVILKKIPTDSCKTGQIVLLKTSSRTALIHRIVRIKRNKSGKKIITKGDANLYYDMPVNETDIIARVVVIEKQDRQHFTTRVELDTPLANTYNYFIGRVQPAILYLLTCTKRFRYYFRKLAGIVFVKNG